MSQKALQLYLGQVVQTTNPLQFNSGYTDDETGEDLPPGSIRVRLSAGEGTAVTEEYAVPADPHISRIPLFGEQVILFSAIRGTAVAKGSERHYYLPFTLNIHDNVNNNVMPFLYDNVLDIQDFQSDGITVLNENGEPEQLSFDTERDVVRIQPLQGDTIIQSRYGSVLRFSGTHAELGPYKEKPFFRDGKVGDPFIALTCEVKGTTSGDSLTDYYKIEDPNTDKSFIYLSSTQNLTKLTFAQDNLGTGFQDGYQKPQVIIGSDRLIFNAKNDELVLVSATDVKVATPSWAMDMDNFFTEVQKLVDTCVKLAEGSYVYSTPAGPTGPSSALGDLKAIQTKIDSMKQ